MGRISSHPFSTNFKMISSKYLLKFLLIFFMFLFSFTFFSLREILNLFSLRNDHHTKHTNRTLNEPLLQTLENIIECHDVYLYPKIVQHGDYWIFENFIRADRNVKCFETVTYTTHGDFTFLNNIVPLLKRWGAPLSVAIYTPGTDYNNTLKSINFLRRCDPDKSLVKQFTTFHLFFDIKSMPNLTENQENVAQIPIDCNEKPPFLSFKESEIFRKQQKLDYPINIARNIARKLAQTYFVLASDIELYPTPNLPAQFLRMILDNPSLLNKNISKVFALSLFEIDKTIQEELPETKTELQVLIKRNLVIPFHQKVCAYCHRWPKMEEWMNSTETSGVTIFATNKRMNKFQGWEPIYIGTNNDPFYDERVMWENKRDKMVQAYILCVQNYDVHVLDNTFLIHKGIRTWAINTHKERTFNEFIPEYTILFGQRKGCVF